MTNTEIYESIADHIKVIEKLYGFLGKTLEKIVLYETSGNEEEYTLIDKKYSIIDKDKEIYFESENYFDVVLEYVKIIEDFKNRGFSQEEINSFELKIL